jgi:hypothetical protein
MPSKSGFDWTPLSPWPTTLREGRQRVYPSTDGPPAWAAGRPPSSGRALKIIVRGSFDQKAAAAEYLIFSSNRVLSARHLHSCYGGRQELNPCRRIRMGQDTAFRL